MREAGVGKESLNLTFLGTPTRWLTLSESMSAQGSYGFRRRVRAVGLEPDYVQEFDRILGARTASGDVGRPDRR